jgi:hypothetical protein
MPPAVGEPSRPKIPILPAEGPSGSPPEVETESAWRAARCREKEQRLLFCTWN